jgi:4-hydroxy-3-polyprenylbenzoate decarboxylase
MVDRLIVGISGASGVIYGIRMLEVLRTLPGIETHLIITAAARQTIAQETNWNIKDVESLASVLHNNRDIGATIASGSLATRGMVIVPCSIKTLSAVTHSYSADLISRAADVTLKEGRPLVLAVRETPLHVGHLRLMTRAAEIGAVIYPPLPAFYSHPRTLDDVINFTVGRILARIGFPNDLFAQWTGLRQELRPEATDAARKDSG